MVLILYASQTGTAEEVAYRTCRDAYQRSIPVEIYSMSVYDPMRLVDEQQPIVMICSTTGHGEEPDSMRLFWKFLRRRDLPNNSLTHINYAVFGLGDSRYEHFNFVAKRLYRRMSDLGGKPLLGRGEGDDQDPLGYDGALRPWLIDLWEALSPFYPHSASSQLIPLGSKAQITLAKPIPATDADSIPTSNPIPNELTFKVVRNQRITAANHFQDVRHLSFQQCWSHQSSVEPLPALNYEAGDVAIIMPRNDYEHAAQIITRLGWNALADCQIEQIQQRRPDISQASLDMCLGNHHRDSTLHLTVRELLLSVLDITRPPTPYFFKVLADHLTTSHPLYETHLEKLHELATQVEPYVEYVWRPKRQPYEVLLDFTTIATIPLDYLFDLFPLIRPREYSIASAAIHAENQLDIVAALVQYKTILREPRMGLCSRWFDQLAPGEIVAAGSIKIRSGSMRLPPPLTDKDQSTPVIFMCAGTGIAPCRAMLQELASRHQARTHMAVYLFFGCRYLHKDCHFCSEFSAIPWLNYFPVGSRDGPDNNNSNIATSSDGKIYLQHWLTHHGQLIGDLAINQSAWFYLCGNSRLFKQVKEALEAIFVKYGTAQGIATMQDASDYFKHMQKQGRFQSETWS